MLVAAALAFVSGIGVGVMLGDKGEHGHAAALERPNPMVPATSTPVTAIPVAKEKVAARSAGPMTTPVT
ncbi:MAG: hypothetical protein OSB69_18580, partial [Alphaproteobacteria bacterium]|nr:hypothetical protein [Alphaproteobacteria bacterium]